MEFGPDAIAGDSSVVPGLAMCWIGLFSTDAVCINSETVLSIRCELGNLKLYGLKLRVIVYRDYR
jgi:hypothetical protein